MWSLRLGFTDPHFNLLWYSCNDFCALHHGCSLMSYENNAYMWGKEQILRHSLGIMPIYWMVVVGSPLSSMASLGLGR